MTRDWDEDFGGALVSIVLALIAAL